MVANEWQPIETAPKGREIFVANATYRRIASMNPHGVWFVMEGGRVKFDGVRLVELDFEPTHWMPLPEPPRDATTTDASRVEEA